MLKQSKSLQLRRRYLLLEAKSKGDVERAMTEALGIIGFAKAAPMFVSSGERLILAVNRESLNDVRAAIELSKQSIRIKRVSGTIKGLD